MILDAFKDGKVLYDPSGLLGRLTSEVRRALSEKGVVETDLYWKWPISRFGDEIEF